MNSSGWDKFRKQQAAEREQLQRLILGMHPLLDQCRRSAPTEIELSALAALLHSFYTGVENIFKRVAVELDGAPVKGDGWHRELLRRMKSPAAAGPSGAPGQVGTLALRCPWASSSSSSSSISFNHR
jgi:hypothetical protein